MLVFHDCARVFLLFFCLFLSLLLFERKSHAFLFVVFEMHFMFVHISVQWFNCLCWFFLLCFTVWKELTADKIFNFFNLKGSTFPISFYRNKFELQVQHTVREYIEKNSYSVGSSFYSSFSSNIYLKRFGLLSRSEIRFL